MSAPEHLLSDEVLRILHEEYIEGSTLQALGRLIFKPETPSETKRAGERLRKAFRREGLPDRPNDAGALSWRCGCLTCVRRRVIESIRQSAEFISDRVATPGEAGPLGYDSTPYQEAVLSLARMSALVERLYQALEYIDTEGE